jgi:spore coat protein JB
LERLRKVDFALIDTVLYLDMYPCCKKALDHYHKLKEEREALMSALAKDCDMPMTSFANESGDSWVWTKGPWPWEPSAN